MEKMHYNISVRLFTAGKCFGPGLATLLSLVRERHSLRAAAAEGADDGPLPAEVKAPCE